MGVVLGLTVKVRAKDQVKGSTVERMADETETETEEVRVGHTCTTTAVFKVDTVVKVEMVKVIRRHRTTRTRSPP